MRKPTFKNILVGLVGDPPLPSTALECAFDLALLSDAHVTVEVDAVDAMPIDAMSYEAAFVLAAVNDRFDVDTKLMADRVRSVALASGVSCRVLSWTANAIALTRNFAALGRTHDLSILDAGHDAAVVTPGYIEAALFETGRPVMVIPERVERRAFQRCLVAWDGSAEAARAVNDAMPFLLSMTSVEIVSVQREDADDRLKGIGLHMKRHGIAATALALPMAAGDVGGTIMAHIRETRPDLVVMGGYSHSRVREWILGGTTRAMLKACPAPLFMSR